jgi:hypothetical protein
MGHPQDSIPDPKKKQAIPMTAIIISGIAVLAIGGYFYTQNKKNQAALLVATAQKQVW